GGFCCSTRVPEKRLYSIFITTQNHREFLLRMEPTMNVRCVKNLTLALATAISLGLVANRASAANQTFNWVPTTTGIYDWDSPTSNWQGGTIADGAGNTAVFTASNPSGIEIDINNANNPQTGLPHIIGNLILNSRASGSGWVL